MTNDHLAPLATDPASYCFIDTETRSPENVVVHGLHRHTTAPGFMVMIVTYAIGTGPVQEWVTDHFDRPLDWDDAPKDLRAFYVDALLGQKWFVAWNAAFDRHAINRGISNVDRLNGSQIETLSIPMIIDAMAQAVKSHLPPDLKGAAQFAGASVQKDTAGKGLIALFCDSAGTATPLSHPGEWAAFRSYAQDDIGSMREVFLGTMPLARREWEEYWASEKINDRGLPIDMGFVRQAAALAEFNAAKANAEVKEISGGALYSVNQHAKMTDWVLDRLDHLPRVRDILTKELIEGEPDEEGNDVVEAKLSLERARVEELILYLEDLDETEGLTDDEFDALRMLEVRVYGASATPKKFVKMVKQASADGRLHGSYVFNGAPATGRFSSRGIQTHNLPRSTAARLRDASTPKNDPFDDEADAIDMIAQGGADAYEPLRAAFGPVGRTLSRVIRPAITAPHGSTLVWGDWSAIEARVLPWLADSPRADALLDVFRANDADPTRPDIYRTTASGIFRVLGRQVAPGDIDGGERQSHGKVPTLALGFGGGEGALAAMAANYGVVFPDDARPVVVEAWRNSNPWARGFWDSLWQAALKAMERPGEVATAGRLALVTIPDYLGGTLFLILPDGRQLLYPRIKWERREVQNKKTGETHWRDQLTYQRGRGRSPIWYGTLAENATQGFAGSLMRNALRQLSDIAVGHTHDEALLLLRDTDLNEGTDRLREVMNTVPAWAAGLPLKAEIVVGEYYTKTLG